MFRLFEHTADVGVEVEAEALDQLFADAARGMFEVIRSDNEVAAEREEQVQAEAADLGRLLVDFLEEFVFLQDAEGLVFRDVSDVDVSEEDGRWQVSATVTAEPFSHERHPGCVQVKAVTRHEAQVKPPSGGRPATARIIFDI